MNFNSNNRQNKIIPFQIGLVARYNTVDVCRNLWCCAVYVSENSLGIIETFNII